MVFGGFKKRIRERNEKYKMRCARGFRKRHGSERERTMELTPKN